MAINKLKVVFEPQIIEQIDISIEKTLLTQLMVTVTQIGLRTDLLANNDIITKENEHGEQEK